MPIEAVVVTTINYLTRIRFDTGSLAALPDEVRGLGVARPLLVTDPGVVAPMVEIPTTAGTGAEVGRAATVILASGRKAACVSPNLIPKAVICDPELTYSLPPSMTAATRRRGGKC